MNDDSHDESKNDDENYTKMISRLNKGGSILRKNTER